MHLNGENLILREILAFYEYGQKMYDSEKKILDPRGWSDLFPVLYT